MRSRRLPPPFPSLILRLRNPIWDRLETIQDHDREVAAKAEPAEPPGEKKKEAVQLRYRRAQVQGLMALGALGRAWFDEPGFKDQVDFEQTRERILSPITETENEARAWWKQIAQAGDSIGLRWRSIAPEIDEALTGEDSRRAELRIVQDRFKKADRLGRLIDGGAPAVPESKIEATGIYRQKRVHDLLIWLAERSLERPLVRRGCQGHQALLPRSRAQVRQRCRQARPQEFRPGRCQDEGSARSK